MAHPRAAISSTGSASLTTDASGIKTSELRYRPFGEVRYSSESAPSQYQFTGQEAETGVGSLYNYGAREYSPILDRFISADTIVPGAGNPQNLNRYSYAPGNPMTVV